MIQRNLKLIEMLKEQNRLAYEFHFSEKYLPRFRAKEFWLGGVQTKNLLEPMLEYLEDYQKAFHKKPEWVMGFYINPKKTNIRLESVRKDLETFKQVMRQEHKRGQNDNIR